MTIIVRGFFRSMPVTDCRIRVLPDLLVRKIAAGEVIERPASVVKELLENALDAGATRIAVAVEDGGRALVRVTDNGDGMAADELRLAVAPHATSKLIDEDDLYHVGTMGFRGEALASISAVSRVRIVSRRRGEVEGHEIRVAAEQVESSHAAGCPEGTAVEVRDLFFNVPARRKFLRSASTEVAQVHEQLVRVALARPDISFELSHNDRVTHRYPTAGSRLDRIARCFSPELSGALLSIARDERGIAIEAYAAPPSQSRATAQWQYTFVNGRFIRDRNIQHAMREAYRGLMEPSRHGVVFVFLSLDPREVDVNVHPTKIEVRWADSRLVHSIVLSALREAFQRADLTPDFRAGAEPYPVRDGRLVPFGRADPTRLAR
jgi:DNA mismatch repair protein MutL